ncbi:TonB-dependent receptor [Sphingomonas profundi]|uniref:TonB-dependent receptor n=1 Tax=Alterirhizorhabdus profundi TaxID=2681549 RepID=UPI0012E8AD94|nr:TonB-dependent receptor [Sphingomonas profundi]
MRIVDGKRTRVFGRVLRHGTMLMTAFALPATARAQEAADAADGIAAASGEIVVVARRRAETLLTVPVTVSAVTGEQLSARGITNLEGVARTIPGLILAEAAGAQQGGAIALRGIGAADGNTFGDQAVGFYIDGVIVARSSPRKMSEFDLQQIEVLKGPQALYYGKNSPGGVVVIRSADPTDRFEAGGRVGYEFVGDEIRGDGFVSGPIADNLGLRVAASAADINGWTKNIATADLLYSPTSRTSPSAREYNTRVTLKLLNEEPFGARIKFGYGYLKNDGFAANSQLVSCPRGFPQEGPAGPNECKPDDRTVRSNLGTRFTTGGTNTVTGATIPPDPYFRDGVPFSKWNQYLASLELGYSINQNLRLTSTTGYYNLGLKSLDDYYNHDPSFPFNPLLGPASASGFLGSVVNLKIRELSEEVRLTSSFDGPFNFMVGAYGQDQRVEQLNIATANAVNPVNIFVPARAVQKGTSASAFVSGTYKITDTLELSGGVRYSHERKRASYYRVFAGTLPASQGGGAYVAGAQVPTIRPRRSFDNYSPEVVLNWRPSTTVTFYGGWKRGFLSGGFNAASGGNNVATLPDRSYDQETVEGFEGGFKGLLLDGDLRTNLALYTYKINGLQTARIDPTNLANDLRNAATARSKGAEFDVTWRTPLRGLSLNGGVAYNDARYLKYNDAPCYGGQSVAAGCNRGFNANVNRFSQQDLSGARLVRAPKWGFTLGGDHETRLANGDTINITVGSTYSSRIFTDTGNSPGGVQKGYWLLDTSARYVTAGGIEIALIGRNLTNTYYFQRSADVPFGGSPAGAVTSTRPDTSASISRGRELWVRLGFKLP